jgi:hypothetical protein
VVIVFERGLLIRVQIKEHLIPFFKMAFRVVLINMLIHPILSHDQIIFESVEINVSSISDGFVNIMYLRDSW